MTVSQTRKNSTPIKVYCLPDEKAQIQENAEASGLSVTSFIRKVAMGYQVESIVDIEQVVTDRFSMVALLGSGSMGRVYRVKDRELNVDGYRWFI